MYAFWKRNGLKIVQVICIQGILDVIAFRNQRLYHAVQHIHDGMFLFTALFHHMRQI